MSPAATWTTDTKPKVAPYLWTLDTLIWDSGAVGYIELIWQFAADEIWTKDTK